MITVIHPVVLAVRHRYVPVQWYKHWLLYVVWIVIGTSVTLSLTTNRATLFGYEPFRIQSTSMSPTLEPGDHVMADAWQYRPSGNAAVAVSTNRAARLRAARPNT